MKNLRATLVVLLLVLQPLSGWAAWAMGAPGMLYKGGMVCCTEQGPTAGTPASGQLTAMALNGSCHQQTQLHASSAGHSNLPCATNQQGSCHILCGALALALPTAQAQLYLTQTSVQSLRFDALLFESAALDAPFHPPSV